MVKQKKPLFGPAGRAESFEAMGYKRMDEVPAYLAAFGLTAFEYQCGHGVKVNAATMASLKEQGESTRLAYSLHAPYYISMASLDETKRQNSVRYLLQSAGALRMLGGSRIIFHCGSKGEQPRGEALAKVKDMLATARACLDEAGYADIHLCPETMGRAAQIGNLDEILALCKSDARHIPCLDFGHLNALSQGGICTKHDYAVLIDKVGEALGDERASGFHVHMSKIEYTKAGEKRHLTFADEVFGPPWQPFIEHVAQCGLAPVVICESSGTQTEDARAMLQAYAMRAQAHN